MEKILRIFSRKYGNVSQAALLLGSFAFLSQILGLFRDRAIAHFIGPSTNLDAYYAAFRIPDLIFVSIASLVSVTVLIPFILERMSGEEVTGEAKKFLNDIFTVFFFGITLVSLACFFIMPKLASLVAPGFSEVMQHKVVDLSRIMLLSPVLLGLSNLFGTVTQIFRKFFLYALSPVFYNLGIIIGVLFFYPVWGIQGMALGVVLGALMHFVVQGISAYTAGFAPAFSFKVDFKNIQKTIKVSLPRTLGLSFNNIALIAIIYFASYLKSGSISVFNLSLNLQSVPLGIIGLSYAVAAFPALAQSYNGGKLEEFSNHLKSAARAIVFWSLPVMFLFIVLRAQIVRVILGSGAFSWENTRLVAAALAVFSISILAQGLIALFARVYYAGGNTRRPLLINFYSSVSIIALSFIFLDIFNNHPSFRYFIESILKVSDIPGTEVLMLPLAYSFGTIINFLLLLFFIKRDFMANEQFISRTFFECLSASFFMGVISYLCLNALSPIFGTVTFWGIFLQGLISGVLGIIGGIIMLSAFESAELKELATTLHTKFWKAKVIAPPQEGL